MAFSDNIRNLTIKDLLKQADAVLTLGLFGIIMLLVLPVAPIMLDLLLTLSIGVSLLILLVVLYLKDPSEFSVFPTILLGVTLFRLGLNVASTRLILGSDPPFAGNVIQTFGDTVVQGNYVVGAVVFLILVIINFVVITKGAGRIAEVAARFTLDAMPGKQMAIDAELNAGIIDEAKATQRRLKIQSEADFYGSMDGASKFVRGDAVAGLLITMINIIGGIVIGVLQGGLPIGEALKTYTLLSIGDGLVSQIPALIVSVGAGILVTRSSDSDSDLSGDLSRQVMIYPRAMGMVSILLVVFAFMGMPTLPFLFLAAVAGVTAYLLKKYGPKTEEEAAAAAAALTGQAPGGAQNALPGGDVKALPDGSLPSSGGGAATAEQAQTDLRKMIHVDLFAVEVGYGLISLADTSQGGDLLERITGLRQKIAKDMGLIIPPVAVRDNLEMENNEYRLLLRGKEIARSTLVPGRWLAMNVSGSTAELKGVPTIEPVFKLDAVWIPDDERKNAEMNGYTVIDPASVLITHLSETLKENAHHILEREDVQQLIDVVKERNPTLVSELLPDLVNVGLIQRVLQNLLKERISIKNLTIVLETIADFAAITKSPDDLAEQVRKKLGVFFVPEYVAEPGLLKALTLEPRLEQLLISRLKRTQFDVGLMLDPNTTEHILEQLKAFTDAMTEQALEPVMLTTADLRLAFKRFFEPSFPRLSVFAYQEVPNEINIENVGVINAPEGADQQLQQAQQQAAAGQQSGQQQPQQPAGTQG